MLSFYAQTKKVISKANFVIALVQVAKYAILSRNPKKQK